MAGLVPAISIRLQSRMTRRAQLILVIIAFAFTTSAKAEFPDHPIRMIVPQAAGSATDTLTRVLASALADELHQQVVVDDRPGGALTLGLDLTAKSPPDGYTLCMGPIGALAITRHLVVPLDIARDFQPIALTARGQFLLAVSPATPFHSVPELIDYAKQNPGKLLNASSSNGSPGHVGGELFKFMTGTDIVHVPYKGGAPAINDLMAGRVQLMFESLNSIAPLRVPAPCVRLRSAAITARRPFPICRPSPRPAFPAIPRRPGLA